MNEDQTVLKNLVNFILKYKHLYDVSNNHFFIQNVPLRLDKEWMEFLSSLSHTELNAIPKKFDDFDNCPASLKSFFAEAISLSILEDISDSPCSSSDSNNFIAFHRTKAKKSHELRHFYKAMRKECRKMDINRVVDVGCGLGHLLNYFRTKAVEIEDWSLKCVGIEADEKLCCGAAKRYNSDSDSAEIVNIKFVNGDIKCRQILAGKAGERTAMISLHGCGDLQASLLREFVASADEPSLLMTVGCCYHKMRSIDANWPMSAALRAVLPDNALRPPPSFFRLACQEQLSRWTRLTEAERRRHERAFLNRALVECIYEKLEVDAKLSDSKKRQTNRQLGNNWESFREELLQRNSIKAPKEILKWNLAIDEMLQLFTPYFSTIEPFTALQFAIQGPTESLVLLDRFLFLREHSIDAELVPIFNSSISPRNMCLIGRKQTK